MAALRSCALAFGPVWGQEYRKVTAAFDSATPIHEEPGEPVSAQKSTKVRLGW